MDFKGYDIETLAEMLERGELRPSADQEEKPSAADPAPFATADLPSREELDRVELPPPPAQTTDDYSGSAQAEEKGCPTPAPSQEEHRPGDEYMVELPDEEWQQRVAEVVEKLRPFIQFDGGDIEIVEFCRPNIKVRLLGACIGCPSSVVTLKWSLEQALRDEVPGFGEIIEVDQLADLI